MKRAQELTTKVNTFQRSNTMNNKFDVVKTFRQIAKERYHLSHGWSVFTECFDVDDILRDYGKFKDENSLLKHMTIIAEIWDDKYQDAEQYRKEAKQ